MGSLQLENVKKYRCVWISRHQYNDLLKFCKESKLLPSRNSPSPQVMSNLPSEVPGTNYGDQTGKTSAESDLERGLVVLTDTDQSDL